MKEDSSEIIEFLDNLADKSWLGSIRSRWVDFVFHYTDIRNAFEILENGKLLCRGALERESNMPVDNASEIVIANTEQLVKEYVRLYFRPKTPTQYTNEGVRPQSEQRLKSHCPVPIFFLFDSKAILTKDDSKFSQGNLARLGIQSLCSTAGELKEFDFKKIYHTGSFSQAERNEIISHRNAEIVVPDELDLSALKFIACRSPAEKETLLNLLSNEAFLKWSPKIFIDTKANLFERKWSFIQSVYLTSKFVRIDFSPDSICSSTFTLTAKLTGNREKIITKENFVANNAIIFEFVEDVLIYEIEIKLDDNLVYLGRFDGSDEIPF